MMDEEQNQEVQSELYAILMALPLASDQRNAVMVGLVQAFDLGYEMGHVVGKNMNEPFKGVIEMLRSIQWADGYTHDDGYVEGFKCADCGADSEDDHEKGCELAALLKKLTSLEMSL